MKLIIIIALAVWYFGGSNQPTYTGDTKTQATYDIDNCIDEVLDEKPWLTRRQVRGC